MPQRLARICVLTALSLLVVTPAAFADGNDSNNYLGLFIGICIIAASFVGMQLTRSYYGRKRKANQRKNRARAKQKKR